MQIKKILIVEDEDDVRSIMTEKLEKEGFMALTASSGKEAMSVINGYNPDIILMDIILPDFDGAEIVHRMQENPETAAIPVIFLSGIVTDSIDPKEKSSVRVGDKVYPAIGKPFSFEDILGEISKISEE